MTQKWSHVVNDLHSGPVHGLVTLQIGSVHLLLCIPVSSHAASQTPQAVQVVVSQPLKIICIFNLIRQLCKKDTYKKSLIKIIISKTNDIISITY